MPLTSDSPTAVTRAPHRQLVAADDLVAALRALGDLPPRDLEVAIEAPARSPVRAFLREHATPSGGWLNRGWALPLADLAALARVADDCGPLPARLFRHDAEGTGRTPRESRAEEPRLWVTLDHDRRHPPARGSA